LKQVEPDLGGQTGLGSRALRSDSARAARLFERCRPRLRPGADLRILDYGGGNGKLLKPFVDAGHSCHIVDYNDNPIPGVTKLCDDIGSVPEGEGFDLIICSHVLEHVSDLQGLVSSLRRHLNPGGLLYAEVPQEIWAGLKLEADPVTHIDFFTASSLSRLFLENGFQVLESREQVATYGRSSLEVLWLLAEPVTSGDQITVGRSTNARGMSMRSPGSRAGADLPGEARRLLYPSRRATLRRMYELELRPKLSRAQPTI
jgi:SAM-dependent methyltransferase